jgi:hypothetical protein
MKHRTNRNKKKKTINHKTTLKPKFKDHEKDWTEALSN